MPGDAERPRLRELRAELGWTQQQLADKLAQLAWTRGQGHVAVNADMVAKWERGAKGISPRYRALLCQLFGMTADQRPPAAHPSDLTKRRVSNNWSVAGIYQQHVPHRAARAGRR